MMTPKEFQTAIRKLQREIGPNAYISVFLNGGAKDRVFRCSIYPTGLSREVDLSIEGDTFEELATLARDKWNAHFAEYTRQTTRRMALAIIRITADQGHCTDAALRQDFDEHEVKTFARLACEDANAIAGKGPFDVITLGGANGAPDAVEGEAARVLS